MMRKSFIKIVANYILTLMLFSANAQVRYGGTIDTYKGIKLFQDNRNENAYYYLPEGPRIKRDDGRFRFHLTKYLNHDKTMVGGIFSASFDFSLNKEEIGSVERYLRRKNKRAFIKHQLPLTSFKDDPKYGNTSFKIESGVLDKSDNRKSQVLVSGYIPLQSGGSSSVLIELDEKQTSLLEQSLTLSTTDLSSIVQGFYPAINPELTIQISIASKYGYDKLKKKADENEGFLNDVDDIVKGKSQPRLFKFRILGDDNLESDIDQVLEKLVNEKLIAEMLEPTSICPKGDTSCFKLKDKVYKPVDSLYIALTKSGVTNVPVILAGNINFVADSTFNIKNHISVVHLDDTNKSHEKIDFKINDEYLETFKEYLRGVSILIRRDSLSSTEELTLNWSDIKKGRYSKSIKIPVGKNGLGKFQYKLIWSYAKTDTLASTSWEGAYKPFISIAPPLEKRSIDIFFDGSAFPDVDQIVVDFAAKIGNSKKAQIVESIVLTNVGNMLVKSFDLFTDPGSEIVYRTIQILKNNKTKILTAQFLKDNGLVNLTNENRHETN